MSKGHEPFAKINDIIEGEIMLNRRFIVSIQMITVVEEVYDVTGHSHFNKEGNTVKRFIEVPNGADIDYRDSGRNNNCEEFFMQNF